MKKQSVSFTHEEIRAIIAYNDGGLVNCQVYDSARYAKGEVKPEEKETFVRAGIRALERAIDTNPDFTVQEKAGIASAFAQKVKLPLVVVVP
jgi:hypothetical protein